MTEDRRRSQLLQTLRDQGITDERVLAAVAAVPREVFVERPFAGEAYADTALPIACGQTISQPYIVALMTESLKVEPASLGLSNTAPPVGDAPPRLAARPPSARARVLPAAREVPQPLLDQLAVGGLMVIPVEERPGKQDLWRITRDERGFSREHLLPVRFVPLVEGLPGDTA